MPVKIYNPTNAPVTLYAEDGTSTIVNPGFKGSVKEKFMWQFPDHILHRIGVPVEVVHAVNLGTNSSSGNSYN